MDVEATEEELMLRDATRACLASGAPSEQEAASLGWYAMLVPEDRGGAGLGAVAAAVLAEELGRHLHPAPFLGTNVVADAVARFGSEAQQQAILPALAAGTSVATWAIADGPGGWDTAGLSTVGTSRGDRHVVRGTKRWVQDAEMADLVLVTCRCEEGLVQLLIPTDAPGVTVTPLETMDLGRRLADVELADVEVGPEAVLGEATAAATRQLQLAVVLQCAETVGATERVLDKTVAYAGDRIAFGRPIGSFQAVKHHLAEAKVLLEAAQAATWAAARAVSTGDPQVARAVHVAKAFVGRHCPHIVEDCMQVHGGIAMTWEDDCHRYLRRVQSNRVLYGTPAWHADRLCDVVGVAA